MREVTKPNLEVVDEKTPIEETPKPQTVPESTNVGPASVPQTDQKHAPLEIAKPAAFDLNKFKSKRAPDAANVGTLLSALPHHGIADAGDFVRLHPDEERYWSDELCFVNVPIKGQKRDTLHLIDEDLAMRHLSSGSILRFRLVLATKPDDRFFLCHVPTRNLDNVWNSTNLQGCEAAKTSWVKSVSRRDEGVDGYKTNYAHHQDAFPLPKWPTQSLGELIGVTFVGCMIDAEDHPGLLRLIGARQKIT
jgi:hypothetical protein